jgi:hypothetical protein
MMLGMTKRKIAITLPPELVGKARAAVRARRAGSVSAYIARAIEEKAKLDDLAALLDEMLAETGGPLSPTERRAAERRLGLSPRTRKGRAA